LPWIIRCILNPIQYVHRILFAFICAHSREVAETSPATDKSCNVVS